MKKILLVFLVALIVFVFTPQGTETMQDFVDNHSRSSWAPLAHYYLANFCFGTLRHAQALDGYKAYLSTGRATEKRKALIMYRLGVCYDRMKDFDAAIAAFEAFIQKYPSHEHAMLAKMQVRKLRAVLQE